MNFREHYDLVGKHAFLSASQSHWLSYDDARLVDAYKKAKAKEEGTRLHEFASNAINLRIKLADNRNPLNMFVNDVIGLRMVSEQILYYSDLCFGTADAIGYEKNEDGPDILRIFDLKTGYIPAQFKQLNVYTALFCLEYNVNPYDIIVEQRIYQSGEIRENIPDPEEISIIMDKIIKSDKILRAEG